MPSKLWYRRLPEGHEINPGLTIKVLKNFVNPVNGYRPFAKTWRAKN